jgi:hypothetical protein
LESYHPYLLPQEVSKTPTTLGTYGSLPKIKKGHFGFLRPLGVKLVISLQLGHISLKPPIVDKPQPNLLFKFTVRPLDVIEMALLRSIYSIHTHVPQMVIHTF